MDGVGLSAGYSYSRNFTDITVVANLKGDNPESRRWGFTHKINSNVSKYGSTVDMGARYHNYTGNYTLQVDSSATLYDYSWALSETWLSINDIKTTSK